MTVIHIVGTGMCGFFVGYLLKKIINWLEIDTEKYLEQNNRDLFYNYLNNKN